MPKVLNRMIANNGYQQHLNYYMYYTYVDVLHIHDINLVCGGFHRARRDTVLINQINIISSQYNTL